MPLQCTVEVAAAEGIDTTTRGRLLSKFAKDFLESQNFNVEEEVRLAGNEVDLLATDRQTGERHFIECKAHRANIAAESITKIVGNVTMKGFSAGWLISTSGLSKDAKGLWDEWQQKPPTQRRLLQVYQSTTLIDRLIASRLIVNPEQLSKRDGASYSSDACLLITQLGNFWILTILDKETGIRRAVEAFNAGDGSQVKSKHLLESLSQVDSSLSSLEWSNETEADAVRQTEKLKAELQSIVRVPMAEHWADYRPARPEDFVGRDDLQNDIFTFLDNVRRRETRTRLFAIKAPSGWGKSSCVLKIGARALNKRNRGKTLVLAVDSRAAVSDRYGELALYTAFQEAMSSGFIPSSESFSFGGASNPFSTPAMRVALDRLEREGKVLCLVFDQFEELLFKNDLEPIFDQLRALCDAVDEAQGGVVIGFSWKTDGTIAPEHKAYHLWHGLADRRLEFELKPFNDSEITVAINRFAKELGQPLTPQLRRLLQDHSQGYPWLLKKLCLHILDLVRSGMDQSDILLRSLSIQELFKRDVQGLTPSEFACVKNVCNEAPAEFYKIVNLFGAEVVQSLVEKRLLIRSGPRLNVYWDIFRDYILNERIPYIPINYVPQLNLRAYVMGVKLVLEKRSVTYDELARHLEIAEGTADNLVRDLVMVGHAESNRKGRLVSAIQDGPEDAEAALLEFCSSHVLYRSMLAEIGVDGRASDEAVKRLATRVLRAASISEKLLEVHRQKMLRWFISVGLIERHGREFTVRARPKRLELFRGLGDRTLRRGLHLFVGEAPWENVLESLKALLASTLSRDELEAAHGRNTFSALMNLGLVLPDGVLSVAPNSETPDELLRTAALGCPTIVFVGELLKSASDMSGEEVGEAVATRFGMDWSPASRRRSGSALRRWATWAVLGEQNNGRVRRPSGQLRLDV